LKACGLVTGVGAKRNPYLREMSGGRSSSAHKRGGL